MILDIHTHHPQPYPQGVINVTVEDFSPVEGQLYSVGIHPWDTSEAVAEERLSLLEKLAAHPQIVAIGECGVDLLKGGPMFRQLQLLKRHIEISEAVKKPVIMHVVKGSDIIMGLKRDLQPEQQWIIHGFRGKPQLAEALLSAGIHLSFGPRYNIDTVKSMPVGRILAETDDSPMTIDEVIASLSEAVGRDLLPEIKDATARVLRLTPEN